tara:strand:+ start:311 stop:832 length:522 start_codon:yes stop_codon:yes gene_type:complete
MKNIYFLIILFMISGCINNDRVYWCGDHPCINKKEKDAYFKKNMIVEVKSKKSKKNINKSQIEKILKETQLQEKKRIKDEKNFVKLEREKEKRLKKEAKIEEKRRKKEEKELAKQIKKDEKKLIKKEKKVKKLVKIKQIKNENIQHSKFNDLVEKIIQENNLKPYPDINNIAK